MFQIKKLTLLLTVFVILFGILTFAATKFEQRQKQLAFYKSVLDQINEISSPEEEEVAILKEYKTNDIRIAYLKYFFRKYNSVLYDYADFFVQKADENGFDYRLLPAIAMQESGLCNAIIEGSHNCWGWGIYGNKVTRFATYQEAISTISRGIKRDYIDKGLTTPDQIMRKYTPSSQGSWAYGVNTFLKVIE